VTGRSHLELADALHDFVAGKPARMAVSGKDKGSRSALAFVFSGHGSDWCGMGQTLFATQPVFRRVVEECDRLLRPYADWSLAGQIRGDTGPSRLDETAVLQPVLFAIQIGLAELWRSWGVTPDWVVGHSVGEVAAAHVAGILTLEEAMAVIAHRGRLMQRLSGHGLMAAVFAPETDVQRVLSDRHPEIAIAAVNSPASIVVSGEPEAVRKALLDFEENGLKCKELPIPYAFHSPQLDGVQAELADALGRLAPHDARIRMMSSVTGRQVEGKELTAGYWARNVRQPVRFGAAIAELEAAGCRHFLEISPHPILAKPMAESCGSDPSEHSILGSLRRNEDEQMAVYHSLGRLYAEGYPVNWTGVYPGPAKFVDLPRYPWQRERFWVDTSKSGSEFSSFFPGMKRAKNNSPLLGRRHACPIGQYIYENRFSSHSPSFLKDHRLKGALIVPAVAYLEMILEAAVEIFGAPPCVIENFSILDPLILTEAAGRILQTVLTPGGPGEYGFQIFSRNEGDGEDENWSLHVEGRVRKIFRAAHNSGGAALDELKERCTRAIPVEAYYKFLLDRGFEYGPAFRGIAKLWRGPADALGSVHLAPQSGDVTQNGEVSHNRRDPQSGAHNAGKPYQIHPGVLEACLQSVGALADQLEVAEGHIFVPIGIESLRFEAAPRTNLWSHGTIRPVADKRAQTVVADVRILDESGVEIVEVRGLQFKRASQFTAVSQRTADWFYEIAWQPAETPSDPVAPKPGPWLVFSDGGEWAASVRDYLRAQGESCVVVSLEKQLDRVDPFLEWAGAPEAPCRPAKRSSDNRFISGGGEFIVNPREPDDFRRLLETAEVAQPAYAGVLYFWTQPDGPEAHDRRLAFADAENRGCAGALHLAQQMAQRRLPGQPPLWIVTQGAQGSCGTNVASGELNQSLLWGFGRSLAVEHPELVSGLVDWDRNEAADPAQLFTRIAGAARERQFARRNGTWLAGRLVRSKRRRYRGAEPLREDATYLIAGGLGSLGLHVGDWCVERGARHLLLIGRSAPSEAAREKLAAMESTGVRVQVAAADVSDREALRVVLERAAESMPPIRGIIHAAGLLEDRLVAAQEWSRFAAVFAPKVEGAWNLHELTKDTPLDFFVLFSSIASVLGSPAQSNYAAANCFLDSLAHYRKAQGLPAISVNWGPWAGGGMASREGRQGQWGDEGIGIRAFAPEEALRALGDVLRRDVTQTAVMSVNWARFSRLVYGSEAPPFFSQIGDVQDDARKQEMNADRGKLVEELRAAHPAERRDLLIARIRERIVTVLGLESGDEPAAHRGFFDMGMDSLMALELKNALQSDLALSIAPTLVFEHPTVEDLSDYLLKEMLHLETVQPQPVVRAAAAASSSSLGELSDHELLDRIEQLSEEQVDQMLAGLMEGPEGGDGTRGQ